MNVDWAKRCRIKEAYGFAQTEFTRLSWRRALNLSDDYHFEDTKGVFPLENYPNERTSFYHDCHLHFMDEYVSKYGVELEYDKELAMKTYPTEPIRYEVKL